MSWIVFGISAVVLLLYGSLLLYYRMGWISLPESLVPADPVPSLRLSIIIPARNEAERIGACLQSIQQQHLSKACWEVWVMDDFSEDATADIVRSMNDPNIHLVHLSDWIQQPINSYKKKAIELGISMATGDIMVTTDADCIVSPNWLGSILDCYSNPSIQLVAAPVMFSTEKNFLSIFQALDFMTLQGITGAAAYQQVHSMCNGANLSYRKSSFMAVGGFQHIDTHASGDDMMLMHKIYRRFPQGIRFLKSKEAIVTTSPMRNWSDFLNQRIRWASKADRYDDKRIIAVLVLVYFFNAWIVACGLAATVNLVVGGSAHHWWLATLMLLACKTGVELYFLFPVARFFQQLPLLWWFPFAQPFHILYTLIAGWLGKFGSYKWKGRVVH